MRLRRNNSLVSFIISQSHIKWEVFLYYFFTRQSWMRRELKTAANQSDLSRCLQPFYLASLYSPYLSSRRVYSSSIITLV